MLRPCKSVSLFTFLPFSCRNICWPYKRAVVHPNVSCVPLPLSSQFLCIHHNGLGKALSPDTYLPSSPSALLAGKTRLNLPCKPCINKRRAHMKTVGLTPSVVVKARSWPRYLHLARNLRKRGNIRPSPHMLYDAMLKYRSNITMKLISIQAHVSTWKHSKPTYKRRL